MFLEKIQNEIKEAMKARNELKVSTLRLLLSALKYEQVAKMRELTEEDILAVVAKQVKQRKESIESFEKGGRPESAEKEKAELNILMGYMPAQLSQQELEVIVDETISQMGASDLAYLGRVIGAVNARVKGGAPGHVVAQIVKEKLA